MPKLSYNLSDRDPHNFFGKPSKNIWHSKTSKLSYNKSERDVIFVL
jgi:hypothetical protein